LVLVGLAALVVSQHAPSLNGAEQVGLVAGLLALPLAAYAFLQFVLVAAPTQASAAACDGAVTAGSAYQGKTGPYGSTGVRARGRRMRPSGGTVLTAW
jgi:hypothetical protein